MASSMISRRALLTVDKFVAKYKGKYVDVDKVPPQQPYQCTDLFNRFHMDVMGGSYVRMGGGGGASNLWTSTNSEMKSKYRKVSRRDEARKGDVAVWRADKPNSYGLGHVSIVLADQGSNLKTLSQNPGRVRVLTDSKAYLLGYFRPRSLPSAQKDRAPKGSLSGATSPGALQVTLSGTAYDPDTSKAVSVTAYVHARRGAKGAVAFSLGSTSDKKFTKTLTFKSTWGPTPIYVYASYGGKVTYIGSAKVNVKAPVQGRGFTPGAVNVTGTYSPVSGDFDGDGRSDIIWYGPGSNNDAIWYGAARGTFDTSRSALTVTGNYIPIPGDFDGDGKDDVIWYGPGSGHDAIWYGEARGTFDVANSALEVAGTYRPVTGDFDGDGKDDVFWYGPGSTSDSIWFGDDRGSFVKASATAIGGSYNPVPGDFDADGKGDVLWYGPGAANDAIWFGTGRGSFDMSDDLTVSGSYTPIPGDFDGGGFGDVIWYGPGDAKDAAFYGRSPRGSFDNLWMLVKGTYRPVAGDFDGDGRGDVFWYGPGKSASDAIWYGGM
jgi:hypothetical protein